MLIPIQGRLALGLAAGLILAAPLRATAADLTTAVFISPIGEVLKTQVIEPFAKQNKLDVAVDNRDWGLGAVRAKIEAGNSAWDVVSLEEVEALQACDEGLFQPLDRSKLTNLPDFDAIGEGYNCGVPIYFYSSVLAYDKKRIKEEPTSWADLWDLKKWPGKRAMHRSVSGTLEIALMADGVPRNEVYKVLATKDGVDRAFRKLDAIKSSVVWWQNPGQSRQMLASGEVALAVTYDNGIRFFNKTQGTDFGLVRKDAIVHVDFWGIVQGSKHVDKAYAFLNDAMGPQKQAAVTNGLAISTPNRKAMDLVDADLRPFLTPNPENLKEAISLDAKFWLDNTDALTQRFEAWLASK
ncbi:ABC transporter substrate-binding protein [uncultured Bosea sp.]|uniref:ABC transporter substrate-binding protein n=1 Tax=uncultured Bosea sp. TaxID=211457 RepID=UPI0025F4D567|nr:ABC transporter substrate-binding protein [uncultured Bosea sp.]